MHAATPGLASHVRFSAKKKCRHRSSRSSRTRMYDTVTLTYFQVHTDLWYREILIIHETTINYYIIVGTNIRDEILSSTQLSWSRDTWGNSETFPVARFPCTLYIEAYQPTINYTWKLAAMPISWSSMQWIHSHLLLSSHYFPFSSSIIALHMYIVVWLSFSTSVMLVLVTLFRLLDIALHPSSMNLQIQTRWVLTLASFTKSSFPDSYLLLSSTSYPPPPKPLPHISIPLPRCQTKSWARFL